MGRGIVRSFNTREVDKMVNDLQGSVNRVYYEKKF